MDMRSSYTICKIRYLSSLIIFLSVATACNETREVDNTYLGYDFYPLEIGRYSIYQVEEINYLISGFDTSSYFLKEKIVDTISSAGSIVFLVEAEKRFSESGSWILDSLFSLSLETSYLSKNQNNRETIDLAFPVRVGKSWDANSLNSRAVANRYYAAADSIWIDSVNLTDHIRVVLAEIEPNITGVDMRQEVYVRGIGLVSRDYLTQINCTASSCEEDLGEVIAGRKLKQHLIEQGYEE